MQELRNKSLKKAIFHHLLSSFSYKTLVKDSLPTKPLLELRNLRTERHCFCCSTHFDLVALQTGKSGSFS